MLRKFLFVACVGFLLSACNESTTGVVVRIDGTAISDEFPTMQVRVAAGHVTTDAPPANSQAPLGDSVPTNRLPR